MNTTYSCDDVIPSVQELTELSYDPGIYLCKSTLSRWYLDEEKQLIRDLDGERDWKVMGEYVGKTYQEMFLDAYERTSKNAKNFK